MEVNASMNQALKNALWAIGRVNHFILALEKAVLSCLMIGMLIFGFLQVFARFVLKAPIGWSEELLTYSFTWTSFLGASMAIYTKGHFSVDLLMKKLPAVMVKPLNIFTWLLILVFSLFILILGSVLTKANTIQRMNILPISMMWAYMAMPVCGAFIFLHALEKTLEVIFDLEATEGAVK